MAAILSAFPQQYFLSLTDRYSYSGGTSLYFIYIALTLDNYQMNNKNKRKHIDLETDPISMMLTF